MRKLFFALLLLANTACHAQSADRELNEALSHYMTYSTGTAIDQLMNYLYPRVFELAPKEAIAKALKDAYNSEEISIVIDSAAVLQVDSIRKFGKGNYTRFSYLVRMKMKILNNDLAKNTEAIKKSYYKSIGEKNVHYDDNTGYFTIMQSKEGLAIKDNYSKKQMDFFGNRQ
jgi:hypothetical protein